MHGQPRAGRQRFTDLPRQRGDEIGGGDRRCKASSASRTGPINACARGVGCMPAGVRTNSGSPRRWRNFDNQMLAVGWLWPSSSAARVTLRVRCSRSNRRSSFGSCSGSSRMGMFVL